MRVLDEKERDKFNLDMLILAYIIYSESEKGVFSIPKEEIDSSDSIAIGMAVGQIYIDEVLKMTENMSREELVLYLAQSSADALILRMHDDPKYATYATTLGKQLYNKQQK